MAQVESIKVMSKEKKKSHNLEVTIEFNDPVTAYEAETIFLEALSRTIYNVISE